MKKNKFRVVYKYSDIHPPKKISSYHKYYKAYYAKHKIVIREKQRIYYKEYYSKYKVIILSKSKEKLRLKRQREKLHSEMKRLERIHYLKKKYGKKWHLLTFKITIRERRKARRKKIKDCKWLTDRLILHFD